MIMETKLSSRLENSTFQSVVEYPTNYATRNNLQYASLNKCELSNASGSSLVHHMKLEYMGKSEKQPNKQTTLKMTTKPKKQYSEK